MPLLLDTHAIIWWLLDDERLSKQAIEAIGAPDADVRISAASAWEIATKVRLGKMPEMADRIGDYARDVSAEGFALLAIEQHHALRAGLLRGSHGDPFDRVLAAQALAERLTVITRDSAFRAFGCEVLW